LYKEALVLKVPSTAIAGFATMIVAVSGLTGCGGAMNSPSTSSSATDAAGGPFTTTPVVSPEDLDPSTYQALTPREFALLVKNPDASIGRKVVLYGVVTQFDKATGQNSFIARTGAEPGDYSENSIFYAHDQSILSSVVAEDTVTIWCTGNGTETYTTQSNGERTVPKFWVNIIKDQSGGGR
jgi:hypothetical protein